MKSSPIPHHRITLRDIARQLGLSHVTISLALRDNPRISPERREQIKSVARSLGYRPDPMLTALSQYRHSRASTSVQSAIAWLNLWPDPRQLRSYGEFDAYWHGAIAVAEAHGYRLEEFSPAPRFPLARIEQVLLTRNVQGILIPPAPKRKEIDLHAFKWSEFAVVRFGHGLASLPVHLVTTDQVAAGRLAFDSVRERGYKRIGFIATDTTDTHTFFIAGILQSQSALPLAERLPFLLLPEAQPKSHLRLLKTWLKRARPDAIITQAPQVRGILRRLGLAVPGDVALAALSVLDGDADAGIDQNSEEVGRVAAETLVSLINHNHRGIPTYQRRILVEGMWTDGESLPDRTKQPAR